MTNERKLPEGRLGRLTRLAGLGARTGASLLLRRDAGARAAEQAAEVLGTLRGLAAKVGQMASYVDGMVPDAYREAYETALGGLRSAAPTSPPAQIRALVEDELKAPIDTLFAEWDDTPLASASIGQVHRARLPQVLGKALGDARGSGDGLGGSLGGSWVAVKVQHPGITSALESDLDNAGIIQGLVATVGPRHLHSDRIFEEVKQRFREELDYTLEAERQEHFVRLHRGDPHIDIPEVVRPRSGRRVLTTVLKTGTSLEAACAAPEALRRRYAETLWRFVFKGNLVGGMFNADPHPGNYLFQPDGRIAFLDFGCVQPISDEHRAAARAAHHAALRRDDAGFRASMQRMLGTSGGTYERAMLDYLRHCFEPLFASPFRLSRAYAKSLVERVVEMKKVMLDKDAGYVPPAEGLLFMNRLQFGFFSVLARLVGDLEVDYAALERAFLPPE
ncbi:MAG: AarF/ABC1/UbiB kinase family protein [Polyangia bacterium]